MPQLTEQMNAALATLESKLSASGLTADQVTAQIHTVIDPQISDLKSSIDGILASEKSDEDKLADVTAAVTEFTTAFAPATSEATPEPAPEPSSAPDASPEPAPAA